MKKNKARERLKANPKLVNFLKLVLDTNFITKRELNNLIQEHFNEFSDRDMRRAKQALQYDKAIIADPHGAGYRCARHSDILSNAELDIEIMYISKQVSTNNKRIESEKMAQRPLIAHLKMLQKAKAERASTPTDECFEYETKRQLTEYDCRG